jgi:hypothetical protein
VRPCEYLRHPIQALRSATFYNCEPAVLEGLEGNEPYIARKFNVAEIQYKECTDEFVDMWRSLLGNTSDGLPHADVGESFGEEDGLWAEEKTIKQYQYNRDKRWVAKVVLLGTGVMVLDTKVYPDIDDMIRRRDASPYLDPASDKYFGDTQSLDRDIAGILEQPRYGDQYQTLKDL